MTDTVFYVASAVLVLGILAGISLMSRVQTAVLGNRISAVSALLAILLTMWHSGIIDLMGLWICLLIGLLIGLLLAWRVKMIHMPQTVALLNGFGGASSALIAIIAWQQSGQPNAFLTITAALALAVGAVTFTGSMIAAAKLQQLMTQKPVVLPGHAVITGVLLLLTAAAIPLSAMNLIRSSVSMIGFLLLGSLFGIVMALRVGGADMPITISLLNALSGVAGSIAGMVIENYLLVVAGSVVGASGLLLTQMMCRAMNRSLKSILLGQTAHGTRTEQQTQVVNRPSEADQPSGHPIVDETGPEKIPAETDDSASADPYEEAVGYLRNAQDVIIVPGYGMALAQAQEAVRQLTDILEGQGARVRFAIHPVAGRMPGHMNVLLCEVDIPYEQLYEMDTINPEFAACDVALIIGANDVVNPAANTAEGTPIYGMPVLDVGQAKHLIICNYDLKPGYAGVDNPLYQDHHHATLLMGDAAQTVTTLITALQQTE